MLIIRVLIAIGIVVISSLIGIKKAKKYESREYILKETIDLFKGIQNEMEYTLSSIPNAIESIRIRFKTRLRDVLGAVSFEMLKHNIQLNTITNEIENLEELTAYDRQIISLGLIELGKTDIKGQIGIIKSTCINLERQLKEATDERQKNSKLFKTVGVATGLIIAIIFI